MGFDTIHETAIKDIVDIIKMGINASDTIFSSRNKGVAYSSSLTKATKGLIMEFPVLVSKANHIESAGIVAKAYEAKFVTLLHMAFAACGITDDKNGLEFVRGFHTYLDKVTVDDFMDFMGGMVKENYISADTYSKIKSVTEDMKNLCYYFGSDINESSLENYKILNNYGNLKVIKEAPNDINDDIEKAVASQEKMKDWEDNDTSNNDDIRTKNDTHRTYDDLLKTRSQLKRNRTQNKNDAEKLALDKDSTTLNMMKNQQDMITNYIVPSDLKKANELAPTMMIVNFILHDPNGGEGYVNKQMVIGVKAKLYEVEPTDVINKIITKNVDNNILLKLVKVSTREISFVKDFLLAIDAAKVDALARSKRGSTNKLFKVLERRALGSKIRKTLRQKDCFKAITSLVISQEEVEELLKNNIDVSNPSIIRPIMEKLNLISFAIIDESSESVKFLFDTGDDIYETIPLSKLEREQKDGMSKKVINLMAKMNR